MPRIPCPICYTKGKDPVFPKLICNRCGGHGYINTTNDTPQGGGSVKSKIKGQLFVLAMIAGFILFIWYMATKK